MKWVDKLLGKEELLDRIEFLETDRDTLIEEIGNIAAYCDKCSDEDITGQCFKCNGTGVVKKKYLITWPW